MSRQIVVWVVLSLAVLLPAAFAADPTETISGTVLDSSGAPVPKARVVATNTGTGLSRETTTASDGGFVFLSCRLDLTPSRRKLRGFAVSCSAT